MTEYDRIGRLNEWLEDNECHKTEFYSILQMRRLFRYWHNVSIILVIYQSIYRPGIFNSDSDFKCVQQKSSSVAKPILDTSSTTRGFGEEPGLVTICIKIFLVGIIIQLKYFKYSRTKPCKKAWDETNEKYQAQYHTVLTIMILLGKTFG